jgi:hypothetical protein
MQLGGLLLAGHDPGAPLSGQDCKAPSEHCSRLGPIYVSAPFALVPKHHHHLAGLRNVAEDVGAPTEQRQDAREHQLVGQMPRAGVTGQVVVPLDQQLERCQPPGGRQLVRQPAQADLPSQDVGFAHDARNRRPKPSCDARLHFVGCEGDARGQLAGQEGLQGGLGKANPRSPRS